MRKNAVKFHLFVTSFAACDINSVNHSELVSFWLKYVGKKLMVGSSVQKNACLVVEREARLYFFGLTV